MTDVNGEAAEIVGVLAANGGALDTDPTNFDSELTGSAQPSDINSIESANGNGSIDGTSLTDINGEPSDVLNVLAANGGALETDPTNFDSNSQDLQKNCYQFHRSFQWQSSRWHVSDRHQRQS